MDGQKYERRVASYLRDRGFRKVDVTKASGDYGVDITARKLGKRYAIQCKYYSRPVGVNAVQQVVGGKAYYECDRAMVVTNTTFTRQAKELAELNDVILIENYKGSPITKAVLLKVLLLCVVLLLIVYKWSDVFALGLEELLDLFRGIDQVGQ
ncbi:MAG: restriction endonuclease [Clostridiales bacterium]|nr:restriction endonuclease [Clostridiales bacterium]